MRLLALATCLCLLDVMQPPLAPPTRPAAGYAPVAVRLERDSGTSDRFSAADQVVSFPFACEAGELSLFALESYGYARGWRSAARIRVLDSGGNVLVEEARSGPSVWHQLTPFVAPARGEYRYELAAREQPFRYRIVRRSGCKPRGATAEPLGDTEIVRSYLARADDVARYEIELQAGEEVFLKVSNTEEPGRAERRSVNPPRLAAGSLGGFVYPTFELSVALGGLPLVEHERSVLLRAPRSGTYVVSVSAHVPGAAGLFDLEARRRLKKVAVWGSVRDHDDAPVAGARLTFLHGIDRDPVGAVRTAADGTWAIDVPPGRLRIRVESALAPVEIDAVVDAPRELVLVP